MIRERKFRRIVSLMLTLLMIFTVIPNTAFAENETVNSISFRVTDKNSNAVLEQAAINYELWAYESDIGLHIETEEYDAQNGVSYLMDADNNRIGIESIDAGDWMIYEINVPSSGSYRLVVNAAGMQINGSVLELRAEDDDCLTECSISMTGITGASFSVFEGGIVWLEEGIQKLKLYARDGGYNLDWFELVFMTENPEYEGSTAAEQETDAGTDSADAESTEVTEQETESEDENESEDLTEAEAETGTDISKEAETGTADSTETEPENGTETSVESETETLADNAEETKPVSTFAQTETSNESFLEHVEESSLETLESDGELPNALNLDNENSESAEDNESKKIILSSGSLITDSNGEAVISGISDFENRISTDKIHVSYNVGKDYYDSETDEKAGISAGEIIHVSLKKTILNVSVDAFNGGEVSISSSNENLLRVNSPDESSNINVEAGTVINLSVKADEKHEIFSVTVNGVQCSLDSSDKALFEMNDIIVEADTDIRVEFIRIYTASAEISNASTGTGNITINDADIVNAGDIAVVREGDKIKVTASPDTGYRVLQVEVYTISDSGAEEIYTQSGFTLNDYAYSDVREADNSYRYVITFSENIYYVTASVAENFEEAAGGAVSVSTEEVLYGGSSSVTIVPEEGYNIESIIINPVNEEAEDADSRQVILNESDIVRDGESASYQLTEIKEDKNVLVSFTKIEEISGEEAGLGNNLANAARVIEGSDKDTYVFSSDASAKFEITAENAMTIRINGNINEDNPKLFEITENTQINTIEVYYQETGENFAKWYTVSPDKTINIVFDRNEPTANIKPQTEANSNNYYNNDIIFNIEVSDIEDDSGNESDVCSGIKSIEYYVECKNGGNTVITQGRGSDDESDTGLLYMYMPDNDEDNTEICNTVSVSVTVDAEKNNGEEVTVYVIVTDNAGKSKTYSSEPFGINTVPPAVSAGIDGKLADEADEGYYNTARTAEVVFSDRNDTFDEEAARKSIIVNGESIADDKVKFSDADSNGEHTAIITFDQNGLYSFSVGTYTNKAGLSSTGTSYTGDSVQEFIIDINENPSGKITVENSFWEKLLETITFGHWSSKTVNVKIEAEDDSSGIKSIEYYKTNGHSDIDVLGCDEKYSELEALYKDGSFTVYDSEFEMSDSESFVIYARLLDKSGNLSYISTDGIIVDLSETGMPTAEIKPQTEPNENNYYNSDSKEIIFDIIAADPEVNSSYSGIKSVEYQVICDGSITQGKGSGDADDGVLFSFSYEGDGPAYNELINSWTGTISVDAEKNNGKDVAVHVFVTDNAGNSEEYISESFGVNTKNPEITVTLERVKNSHSISEGYYVGTVTAKVTITDSDDTFTEEGISFEFDGTDSDGIRYVTDEGDLAVKPEISKWKKTGEGVYEAAVTFMESANYTWSVSYTNKADMPNNGVDADEYAFSFTLDNDAPEGTVSVEGNSWSKLIEILTFGFYRESADISISASDKTSPMEIKYFKTPDTDIYTYEQLEEIKDASDDNGAEEPCWHKDIDWNGGEKLTVNPDEIFVVYAKITDYAGNYIYVSSKGYIIEDNPADIVITEPIDESVKNGFVYGLNYENGIEIEISVSDSKPYSGIKFIEYWVENTVNGKTVITQGKGSADTDNGLLYEFNNDNPSYSELQDSWEGVITVEPSKNNSCDVTVWVRVMDNAGNESEEYIGLDIDITRPVINVSFDNNNVNKTADGRGYFNDSRTAAITIIERTHHFDEAEAVKGISISAVDADGKAVELNTESMISGWNTKEGSAPDEAVHTAVISFTEDANYTFDISYTDKAGNKNSEVNYGISVAPDKFTVDKMSPEGTVKAEAVNEWSERWSDYVTEHAVDLTFGLWTNKKIIISGTAKDKISPLEQIEYLKTANTVSMTRSELEKATGWAVFSGIEIVPDEQAVVYLKITDYAGNVSYIRTDGLVADGSKPVEENIAPKVSVNPQQPVNGIYNSDVKVDIKVTDPLVGGAYSGLKSVRYEVLNMGVVTQSGLLYSFNNKLPKRDELLGTWSGSITVDSRINNSNDVIIKVYAEDNALNTSYDVTAIKIDTTAPSINISYDNNSPDSGKYYKENRVAAVSVTERNFRAEDVKIVINSAHGSSAHISGWSEYTGSGNLDNTVHTAYITYSADDDYTFDISYADMAGNICPGETYAAGTANPKEFTIDKTIPLVSVSYDNDAVKNSNYYNAGRTAFITISEHNFDASRVIVDITASDDGSPADVPAVSGWTTNGDTHTASIQYTGDALYTFDISYTDMAGNAAADFTAQSFYVDTTKPSVAITNIVDESANSGKGNIGFTITASDTNFDIFEPVLSAVIYENGSFVKKTIDAGRYTDIKNGKIFTVENLSLDGIYYLTCTVVDKAGNAYDEVTLYDSDNKPYTADRSGNDTLLTFSVNREGSVYEPDTFTSEINGKYIYDVYDNIILIEINADPLLSYQVSSNGKVLEEGRDYTVLKERGEGAWYKYTYIIDKTLFAEEGEYTIVVSSVDKAESSGYSDVKGAGVRFTVDKTAPTVTVSGLADNGRYQVDKQTVTIIPADDGGRLKSLLVELLDRDGNVIETLINLSGEELEKALNDNGGRLVFDIGEGMYQQVHIVCSDCAENDKGETNIYDYTYTNITVSSNAFMIFWANSALRYGVFIGLTAAVLLLVIILIIKRKGKNKDKDK